MADVEHKHIPVASDIPHIPEVCPPLIHRFVGKTFELTEIRCPDSDAPDGMEEIASMAGQYRCVFNLWYEPLHIVSALTGHCCKGGETDF